ncbi:hypothetical protein GCM10007939_17130 [Amylibacter marinus]|uniref:Cytochrome c556 n=1 Tax=Amylibacter marinus TaxID=1475483 RepID=A0ABQ5VVS2_9RHOB|nr:hypothetical protein [Amylibacter marinus]GLQ35430.1 hypothetical protein GCM10007939_17130 [Amylibacter marinus]
MKRLLIGTGLVVAVATAAMATPDEDITARQATMKAIGAAAKAGDFAAMNAAAIEAKAAFMVDTTGQGTVKTTALDTIWTDADAFNAIMDSLVEKSAAADKAVFGTCKACHADYRMKN